MKEKIQFGKNLMPTPDQVIQIMAGPIWGREVWLRYISVADPYHGAYSIGIHAKCREVKPQKLH